MDQLPTSPDRPSPVPDIAGLDLGPAEKVEAARRAALGLSAGELLGLEAAEASSSYPEEPGLGGNAAYMAAKRTIWTRPPTHGAGDDAPGVIQ